MKEAKQILIVCLIITFVSFIGIMVLHYEIDMWMINRITEEEWKCNSNECEFYQSMLSGIFTGALVSVFTACVSYFRSKHDLEFEMISNAKSILICFDVLSSDFHKMDLKNPHINSWVIFMYKEDIELAISCADKLTNALKNYCPVLKSNKIQKLLISVKLLERIVMELDSARKYIMFQTDVESLKGSMEDTAKTISKNEDALKKISNILDTW